MGRFSQPAAVAVCGEAARLRGVQPSREHVSVCPLSLDSTHYVPCEFGSHLFPALLASGYSIYGHVMEGEVWPVDTPELYRMACTRMAKEPGLKR